MIDPSSKFPDEIDTLDYFSDVTLSQKDTTDEYVSLVNAKRYTEAYDVISNSSIFGWFADYFNMIENRINAVQSYLITNEKQKHPDQSLFSSDEPTSFVDYSNDRELADNDVWISTT